jgi:phage FluMu protein Com
MAGKGTVFPIPCRKCGKVALLAITPGTHDLRCLSCSALTEVIVRQTAWALEVRTGLASNAPSPRKPSRKD